MLAVVAFPALADVDAGSIDALRATHDPNAARIAPHFTLVFPDAAIGEAELVSIDFNGSTESSVVDASCTSVVDGTLVKVLAWYDNEYGYSARVADLVVYLRKFL